MYLGDQGATALLPPRNTETDPEKLPEPASFVHASAEVAHTEVRAILKSFVEITGGERDATTVAFTMGRLIAAKRAYRVARLNGSLGALAD